MTVILDDDERALDVRAGQIRELAAHVHAAEARLAEHLASFLADGGLNGGDWRSPAHWVSVNCGYTHAEATALTRVADKVDQMPTVMIHAKAGEVSLGVAAMAARVATPAIDEQLAVIVTTATPSQSQRMIRAYRELRPRDEPEPTPSIDDSFWRTWNDDHGRWRLDAAATPEIGALMDEAYQAARRAGERERLGHDETSDDELDDDLRRAPIPVAETLRRMADLALEAARGLRLTRPGGEHFNVTVLIDLATFLTGHLHLESTCRIESGPDIAPDLVRRLAEEGTIELLWHREGVPLNLGRKFRLASREQRRALRHRDGGCAIPGCRQTRYLHAHHVQFWENGGLTDLDNLVLLCSWHHALVHHHGWTIVAHGNQRFSFYDSHRQQIGNDLVRHSRRDGRAPPGLLESLPDQQCLGIGPNTARSIGAGESLTEFGADVWMHTLLSAAASDAHLVAA